MDVALIRRGNGNDDSLIETFYVIESVFGVANEIDEYLQNFMTIDPD